jgi:hypothetical protein
MSTMGFVNFFSSDIIRVIKTRKMGTDMACSMQEMRNAYNFFAWKPQKSGQR